MFNNEYYITIPKEEIIKFSRLIYLRKRYGHYLYYTLDNKFLYLYQNVLKELLFEQSRIETTYLKDIKYKTFSMDLANNRLYYYL